MVSWVQVFVPDLSHEPHVCLRVHLPPAYPSSAPPIPEIHGPHLSNDVRAWIVRELESQFTPGAHYASGSMLHLHAHCMQPCHAYSASILLLVTITCYGCQVTWDDMLLQCPG